MKFKVNKSGFVTQVKFGRKESGCVIPYNEYGILCANLHTVIWALEDIDVNTPAENSISEDAVIELWEQVSGEWRDKEIEKYALDFTGLFFKYEKQDYALLTVTFSKLYIAVNADFALPFIQAGMYDFYLQVSSPLPKGSQALDLAREADSPFVLAVQSGRFGDLIAFTLPALIPEKEMSYLR